MCRLLSWMISIFAMCCLTEARTNQFNPLLPLQGISSALEYMVQYPEYLNVDSLFGIAIAEARLRNAEKNLALIRSSKSYTRILLQQLISYCGVIRTRASLTLHDLNANDKKMIKSLLKPNLWPSEIKTKENNYIHAKKIWSIDKIRNSIFKGSPNESYSDMCICQLLTGYEPSTLTRFANCSISDNCVEIMTNGSASGYPLTHRLLYKIIGNRVGCSSEYDNRIGIDSAQLCSEIFTEMIAIYEANVPNFARDLFTEQILLCGLEGYREFLDVEFLRLLLSWQSRLGCWGHRTSHEILQRRRHKRKANKMPGDCVNHITGLATATLALYADISIGDILRNKKIK